MHAKLVKNQPKKKKWDFFNVLIAGKWSKSFLHILCLSLLQIIQEVS